MRRRKSSSWAEILHIKKRKRFTTKANPELSSFLTRREDPLVSSKTGRKKWQKTLKKSKAFLRIQMWWKVGKETRRASQNQLQTLSWAQKRNDQEI
jgi:hypothetical protein